MKDILFFIAILLFYIILDTKSLIIFFLLATLYADYRIIIQRKDKVPPIFYTLKIPLTLILFPWIFFVFAVSIPPLSEINESNWRFWFQLGLIAGVLIALQGIATLIWVVISEMKLPSKERSVFHIFMSFFGCLVLAGAGLYLAWFSMKDLQAGIKKFEGYCYKYTEFQQGSYIFQDTLVLTDSQFDVVTPQNKSDYPRVIVNDTDAEALKNSTDDSYLSRCKYPLEVRYLPHSKYALDVRVLSD